MSTLSVLVANDGLRLKECFDSDRKILRSDRFVRNASDLVGFRKCRISIFVALLEETRSVLDAELAEDAEKTDSSELETLRGLPELEDDLWASAAESPEDALILTEGYSSVTSAVAGRASRLMVVRSGVTSLFVVKC